MNKQLEKHWNIQIVGDWFYKNRKFLNNCFSLKIRSENTLETSTLESSKHHQQIMPKWSKNQFKIDTKLESYFVLVFALILDQNSHHVDSQTRPRASKNRSRGSLRASKTPPRHQKTPKDLPRASPDLPMTFRRTIFDHFFIQNRASEAEVSSQKAKFRRPAARGLPH